MELHEKLRQIRVSRKWSQATMGKELGVSQQVYNNYEKGVNKKFTASMLDWIQENFVEEKHPVSVTGADGKALEALVRIEARQLAQGAYISEIYAKLFDVLSTKVLKDMEQMGKDEARRLLDGLK